LAESDISTLNEFIEIILKETQNIYAYGTSIFRKLSDDEVSNFASNLKEKYGAEFSVVTSDEELSYTAHGVIDNIDYAGRIAVFVAGGGSTELAIFENKKLASEYTEHNTAGQALLPTPSARASQQAAEYYAHVRRRKNALASKHFCSWYKFDFGVSDITRDFPELKDDIAEISFDTILNYTMKKVEGLDNTADVLVLAGGDFIYFYEKANYEMDKNHLYQDENQRYLIPFDKSDFYDHDCLHKSWDEIKSRCPGNEGWWDGARAMRFCVNAFARKLGVKYIIPTRINMIMGITNSILEKLGVEVE